MHPRLQELMTYLDAQRAGVMAAAGAVPVERWTDKPAPEAWSVAEVLEHLRRGEEGLVRLAFKLGKGALASGTARRETETSSLLGALDHLMDGRGVIDRSYRRVAPPETRPDGPIDPQSVVNGLSRTREDLYKAVALVDGLALGDLRWTHPVLGTLDLYQYILFVGQHEARHAQQIAEIATALEAPASGSTGARA